MKVYIEEIKTYDLNKIRTFLNELPIWNELDDKKIILIKPNLLGAYPPEQAVTTHPVMLQAVIDILKEKKKTILIGDGPGGTIPVQSVWEKTGIKDLTEKNNIELVNFSQGGIIIKKNRTIEFPTTKYFWKADAIINMSKYKTHSLMAYTGAVKNLYGLIPGIKKSDYHRDYPEHHNFARVISELYELSKEKPVYNIMDGIIGMEGEGPSAGEPRNFGVVFAGESASAIDFTASRMMGFNPEKISYIMDTLNIDNLKPEDIEIPEKWKEFVFENVKIKRVKTFIKILAYSPKILKNVFRKLFRYYPDFNDKCTQCRICVDSCPVQAMTLEKNASAPEIDYSKCIKCMCCHEFCPHHAVYIRKSFLAKLLLK